jgi:LPS O-antigen subunit length determinant protein (WzzB/FepE family)
LAIIDAAQPYEAVTQYQQMKMMRDMIKGEPVVRKAYEHYLLQNPKFEDQSIQEASKSITTELRNNPTLHVDQASSINNVQVQEDMMEINNQLIQVQAMQEARINQLQAAMNVNTAAMASIPRGPKPPTTKYCHLHGSNNTHDGTECKKMGSTGFTMKGKAVTQAMINNRVPGAVVDGVAGKM